MTKIVVSFLLILFVVYSDLSYAIDGFTSVLRRHLLSQASAIRLSVRRAVIQMYANSNNMPVELSVKNADQADRLYDARHFCRLYGNNSLYAVLPGGLGCFIVEVLPPPGDPKMKGDVIDLPFNTISYYANNDTSSARGAALVTGTNLYNNTDVSRLIIDAIKHPCKYLYDPNNKSKAASESLPVRNEWDQLSCGSHAVYRRKIILEVYDCPDIWRYIKTNCTIHYSNELYTSNSKE